MVDAVVVDKNNCELNVQRGEGVLVAGLARIAACSNGGLYNTRAVGFGTR